MWMSCARLNGVGLSGGECDRVGSLSEFGRHLGDTQRLLQLRPQSLTGGISVATDPGAIDINGNLPLRDKLLCNRISSLGTQGNIIGGSKQTRWIIDLLYEVERIEQSLAGSNPLLRRVIVEWIFGAVEQHLEALH